MILLKKGLNRYWDYLFTGRIFFFKRSCWNVQKNDILNVTKYLRNSKDSHVTWHNSYIVTSTL
jgi:hypothetical protein